MNERITEKLQEKKKTKEKPPAPSIRGKTFGYLLCFCALLLIVLWLFQIVFLDVFYRQIKLNSVKRDAATVVEQIERRNNVKELAEDVEDILYGVVEKGDLYAEIWIPRIRRGFRMGEYYGQESQGELLGQLTDQERVELIQKAIANDGAVTEFYVGDQRAYGRQQETIRHAEFVETGQITALVILVTNLLPVDSTVQTLRVQWLFISGIMLILSVLIALVISRQLARPISLLNEGAKRLGEGDYTVTFDGKGYREIEELSKTLTQTTYELSRTDFLRKELVANVSHDLRTPLTLISGYAEMMRDYPEEYSAENLQVIIDESKRLTSLVSDLLDLSKLQAGMHEPKMETFNLTELVQDIIDRYAAFREHDNYNFSFDKESDVLVAADPARISQVIYNLIGNAINYTGDDKVVHVRQSTQNNRVWIEIIDTGKGMTPEAMENVWNRYYRETSSHNRAVTGSGLGLSIVQTILEQHPGVEFGVLSEVGKGSSFWFSLPMVLDTDAT